MIIEFRSIHFYGMDSIFKKKLLDRIYRIIQDCVFVIPHFPEENEEAKPA